MTFILGVTKCLGAGLFQVIRETASPIYVFRCLNLTSDIFLISNRELRGGRCPIICTF